MEKITLDQIEEGMIVSEDVIDKSGMLIMSKGDTVSSELISKLSSFGIREISIKTSDSAVLDFDQRNSLIEILSNSFKTYALLDTKVFEKIRNQMSSVIAKIIMDDFAIEILIKLKEIDDYTYNHSIHVGMLSGLLAHLMEYSDDDIESCILAGLYHDIGKLDVDREILAKPNKLSDDEFAQVKNHPNLAMDYLDKCLFSTDTIKTAILQHHERRDGSGYPNGLVGEEISLLARILAVADEYDAAISNKVYKEGISPFAASDELFVDSLDALDPTASQTLITFLQKHYIGIKVILNTGEQGEVVFVNKLDPNHPLVKVDNNRFYDLSRDFTVKITDTVRK